MEKGGLPPSYSDLYQGPSAPLMNASPIHNAHPSGMSGWNPNMNNQPQQHHYPQYPAGAQPVIVQPQMTQQQVPIQQTVVIVSQQLRLGENPASLICPHCKQQTITKVEYVPNWLTHLIAGVFCLACWIPCAIAPYCMSCLQNANHKCAKCNGYIGTFRRAPNC